MRSNDVSATRLNDQVHCGMHTALFNDADSTGVAAAPTIVDNTMSGKLVGPNTETAQPIKTPLYPQRPSRQACLSSPIILDVVMDVTDPNAAELVQLRKITCPIARVAESRCSDCIIADSGELGTFDAEDFTVLLFSSSDDDDVGGGGVEANARDVMLMRILFFLRKAFCR